MLPSNWAYIILCGLYFLVWIGFFFWRKDLRKELLVVTLAAAPFGFTEWLFYDYWRPDFLLPVLPRIGVEDFLWCGIVSGIGAVSYEVLAKRRPYHVRGLSAGWLGDVWLSVATMGGIFLLYAGTHLLGFNSAYVAIAFLFAASVTVVFMRRDLLRDALLSGVVLATLTFLIYKVWLVLYPNVFFEYWQLQNISGVFVSGVPLEELVFLFIWGAVIGPLYELMAGLRLRKLNHSLPRLK